MPDPATLARIADLEAERAAPALGDEAEYWYRAEKAGFFDG